MIQFLSTRLHFVFHRRALANGVTGAPSVQIYPAFVQSRQSVNSGYVAIPRNTTTVTLFSHG